MSYRRAEEALRLMRETGEVRWRQLENSKIADFYRDKNVFVTGATGFLGKLLLEKLLRACPDINSVYILVRKKKGEDPQERIDKMCREQIFGPLSTLQPKFQHKINIIKGDVSLPNLDINPFDMTLLTEKINVIFHIAATVRFDEKITLATATNVRGTRDLLKIARQCRNLESFVHVSTAYANCVHKEIDEVFYNTPVTADELIEMVERTPEPTLAKETKKIIQSWPNSYTFTKAIAEEAVRTYGEGLPLCIVRPAIVTATHREPLRSWIDNLYGATGIAIGAGTGLLKTVHCDKDASAEMVPGDYVVNHMIAASHRTALERSPGRVYNFVPSSENRLTWKEMMAYSEKWGTQIPTVRAIWCYCLMLNKSYYAHLLLSILLHFLPAVIMDVGMILTKQRPIMLKIYKKINKFEAVISHFATNHWKFHSDNTRQLWNSLSSDDQKMFDFNIGELDWNDYFKTHMLGLRIYVVKDDSSTIPEGRKKQRRFYIVHQLLKTLFYFIIGFVVYSFVFRFLLGQKLF